MICLFIIKLVSTEATSEMVIVNIGDEAPPAEVMIAVRAEHTIAPSYFVHRGFAYWTWLCAFVEEFLIERLHLLVVREHLTDLRGCDISGRTSLSRVPFLLADITELAQTFSALG